MSGDVVNFPGVRIADPKPKKAAKPVDFAKEADRCAAWDAGIRPDGFEDTRESMKSTKAHLEDMRALAFGKLGVTKP